MQRRAKLVTLASLVTIAACTSPRYRAPVEDRARPVAAAPSPAPASGESSSTETKAPGEVTGKPASVTVKPGDTLTRIAADAGQSWRDIARWNNIVNPGLIEVGQVLRVQPPEATVNPAPANDGAVAARPVATGRVETRPLEAKPVEARSADVKPAEPLADAKPDSRPAPAVTVTPPLAPAPPAPPPVASPAATQPQAATAPSNGQAVASGDEAVPWMWPASGVIGATFDGPRQKGLTILGRAGDPVVAAADGKVIYAGSSLRGYGNIVIVKHNNTYITAYAHNRTLLVKEEQPVRRGQRIAEMGSTDAERVQLHFELRRNGVAVDPAKHLPPR